MPGAPRQLRLHQQDPNGGPRGLVRSETSGVCSGAFTCTCTCACSGACTCTGTGTGARTDALLCTTVHASAAH